LDERLYQPFANQRHAKIQVCGEKEVLFHFARWARTALEEMDVIKMGLKEEQQRGSVEVRLGRGVIVIKWKKTKSKMAYITFSPDLLLGFFEHKTPSLQVIATVSNPLPVSEYFLPQLQRDDTRHTNQNPSGFQNPFKFVCGAFYLIINKQSISRKSELQHQIHL